MARYKASEYTIDRKMASRLLKVSVRTVDRHIKSEHLSTRVDNGRIWLNKDQIIDFRNRQRVKGSLSMDNQYDNVDIRVDTAVDNEKYSEKNDYSGKVKNRGEIIDEKIDVVFKELYEKTKEELDYKQQSIDAANHRIGQLESQLKYSIPLVEHKKQTTLLLADGESLKKQLENEKKDKVRVYNALRSERINKRIYLILAVILILLQPLWLLFLF